MCLINFRWILYEIIVVCHALGTRIVTFVWSHDGNYVTQVIKMWFNSPKKKSLIINVKIFVVITLTCFKLEQPDQVELIRNARKLFTHLQKLGWVTHVPTLNESYVLGLFGFFFRSLLLHDVFWWNCFVFLVLTQ